MEELCEQQKTTGEAIQKVLTNFKKDSQSRKTQTYLESRIDQVISLWEYFEEIHSKIEKLQNDYPDHPYFVKKYKNQVREVYENVVKLLSAELTKFKSSTSAPQEKQAEDKISDKTERESITAPQQVNCNADESKLIQRQEILAKAMKRIIDSIASSTIHSNAYYHQKIDTLKGYWEIISKNHLDIVLNIDSAHEYISKGFYEEIEDIYQEATINLHTALEDLNSQQAQGNENQNISGQAIAAKVKLPPIQIPKFDGNYYNWKSFQDIFSQLIHENSSLSRAQKMHYLKSNLLGSANKLLQHLQITDDNYDTAWALLNSRFNNKRLIVSTHIQKLLSQQPLTHESAGGLKRLHDFSKECLLAVKNLGVETSNWDPIIIQILLQKLDKDSHRHYEDKLKDPRELQSLEDFFSFLEHRFQALESLGDKFRREFNSLKTNKSSNYADTSNMGSKNNAKQGIRKTCAVCNGKHGIYSCTQFLGMSSNLRKELVNKNSLCTNCLQSGHKTIDCKSLKTCRYCKRRHNTLLHEDKNPHATAMVKSNNEHTIGKNKACTSTETEVQSHFTNSHKGQKHVMLATAIVNVKGADDEDHSLRALIDQGSQVTFISEHAAQKLRLKRTKTFINISGIGENEAGISRSSVQITIQPRFSSTFQITTTALVMKKLTKLIPAERLVATQWEHIRALILADPTYNQPGNIDIIIGADIFPEILLSGVVKGPSGTPVTQQTELGWILSGSISTKGDGKNVSCCITQAEEAYGNSSNCNIDEQLKKFWEIEEIPSQKVLTEEDKLCEELYKATTIRGSDGKYTVSLLFDPKSKHKILGESKSKALTRMLQLERRFLTNPALEREYKAFMAEYIQLGHMKLVENQEEREMYFLPHHSVVKEDSTTTRLRVVFDASAKTTTGVSLNDMLLTGPTIQEELFSILLRWRKYEYAFKADIEKMYRQIRVNEKEQAMQRILWRNSQNEPMKQYQLTTVTYGTRSAPYLAVRTLQQLATDSTNKYPQTANVIRRDFYIDDVMSGTTSLEKAIQTQQELTNLLEEGGFKLRKWSSNSSTLLKHIPKELIEKGPAEIDHNQNTSVKALGIQWQPGHDVFEFKVNMPTSQPTTTKRRLLSETSLLFDPLGWMTPITITSKIMLQDLWLAGLGWDEPLPSHIMKKWQKFKDQLPTIQYIKIPRWIQYSPSANIAELHGFSDASEKAYAAAVYFRTRDKAGNIITTLITAKSRVAPISKKLSLPRLELCGALLLTRLLKKVLTSMEWGDMTVHAWTDSTIVLSWIRGHPSKWKEYVANRVVEIQSSLNSSQWHYVTSGENPADIASRGINPQQLKDHKLWWSGPEWLKNEYIRIPEAIEAKSAPEERKVTVHNAVINNGEVLENLIKRHSSHTILTRIVAYCLRFIRNLKLPKEERKTSLLTKDELSDSLLKIVRAVQEATFVEEIKRLKKGRPIHQTSKIISLHPILDNDGILRVGGRLQNSNLNLDAKHPMILPYKGELTTMIIRNAHCATLHGGVQLTLAYTRYRYWIINGQSAIKQFIHKCITCYRQQAKKSTQLMGNLPKERVTISRTFANTGIDYAGPINLRMSRGRGSKTYKGYIVIFICLATKAVHLEAASDLTAEAFLSAFKRFTARRGLVENIYSDNGTNFVLANKILQLNFAVFKKEFEEKIINEMSKMEISWHFNPPSAPHFGGLWEAGVKSIKHHFKRIIGDTNLTFEELTTVLSQIEACLNSRPLCPIPNQSNELEVLTPGHFLTGAAMLAPPAQDTTNMNTHILSRWQLLDRLQQDFWKRWSQEYLTRLQQRPKWVQEKTSIKPGTLVLLKDERLPPTKWSLGKITEVHPGSDGLTRVVTLKTKNGILKRPVTKLCPLPIENSPEEQESSLNKQVEATPSIKRKTEEEESSLNKEQVEEAPSIKRTTQGKQEKTTPEEKQEKGSVSSCHTTIKTSSAATGQVTSLITPKRKPRRRIKIHPVRSPYPNLISPEQQTKLCREFNARKEARKQFRLQQKDVESKRPRLGEQELLEQKRSHRSATTNKTLGNTISMVLLALFVLPIMGAPTNKPVNITPFVSPPGIYFEGIGEVSIAANDWNIICYYNLRPYWDEFHGIKGRVFEMREHCKRTKEIGNYCNPLIEQFEHQLLILEHNNEILYKRNGKKRPRSRRAPFNFVGTAANFLFGVLDDDFAKKYEKDILTIRNNEDYLLKLNQNLTSITESTANIFKKAQEDIQKQFQTVDSHLSNLTAEVNKTIQDVHIEKAVLSFLTISIHITMIILSYKAVQTSLIETVTDIHHGKISPLLITPRQLRNELTTVRGNLPAELSLPIQTEEDVLELYNLMSARITTTKDYVICSMKIPLLKNEYFQLFKIIPVPIPREEEYVWIKPSSDYLLVSPHRDEYYPMIEQELQKCAKMKDEQYLCHQQHPIYNTEANISRCEMDLINHKSRPLTHCTVYTTKTSKVWIQLHNKNNWVFSMNQPSTYNIVCGKYTVTQGLRESGILQLQPGCNIRESFMTIRAQNPFTSNISSSFVPDVNFNQELSHLEEATVNLTLKRPDMVIKNHSAAITQILNQLSQLKQDTPPSYTHHDVHQYTVIYVIITALLITTAYYIFSKMRRQSRCGAATLTRVTRSTQPTPAKRNMHLANDFELQHSSAGEIC